MATLPSIIILIVQIRKPRSVLKDDPFWTGSLCSQTRRHHHLPGKSTFTDSTLPESVLHTRHSSQRSTARVPPYNSVQPTLGCRGSLTPKCASVVFRLFRAKVSQDLRAQEKLLPTPSPLNPLEEFQLGALPIIRGYQR